MNDTIPAEAQATDENRQSLFEFALLMSKMNSGYFDHFDTKIQPEETIVNIPEDYENCK